MSRPHIGRLSFLTALVAACGDPAPPGRAPEPSPPPDELSPPADEGPEDVAPPSLCGNGTLDGRELCDGGVVDCTSLAAVWASGQASCRADCSGYDVDACALGAQLTETVRPAERHERWQNAQCNDGSTFALYVSMASAPTNTWVIYLEGGGRCDGTYGSCVGRPVGFVSSRNEAADGAPVSSARNNGTFFSRDPSVNPVFHAANHAYGRYCSSDLWGGTNTTPQDVAWKSNAPPVPFVFTGHHNVEAMVDILFYAYGLNDATSEVLLTGSSAGSVGAQRQINVIAERMPTAIAEQRFALLLGSAFRTGTFDEPGYPFKGGDVEPDAFFEAVDSIYRSVVDPKCAALAAERGLGLAACGPGPLAYTSTTRAPPLGWGIRTMVAMNRFDQNAMGDYLLPIVSASTPQDLAARDAYYDDMTDAMEPITWLYAPADPQETPADENLHGLIVDPLVWLFPVPTYDGVSLRDLVGEFWRAPRTGKTSERMLFDGSVPHASDAPF